MKIFGKNQYISLLTIMELNDENIKLITLYA